LPVIGDSFHGFGRQNACSWLPDRRAVSVFTWSAGDKRDDILFYALRIDEHPVSHPASVSSGLGLTGGAVFPKLSKLLNQENALSAPCLRGDFYSPHAHMSAYSHSSAVRGSGRARRRVVPVGHSRVAHIEKRSWKQTCHGLAWPHKARREETCGSRGR
jgi:hypothetical protein